MNTDASDGRAHDFDFLIGSWRVEHRRLSKRLVGSREHETFEGTAQCRAVLDGVGNVDEITLPALGAVGMSVRLYDRQAGRWTIYWASSSTGVLEPPVVGGFEGGIGRFYGDDVHDGRPIRVRFIWDQITPESARWQQAFSPDGERTWETNWVMSFTRA